MNPAIPITCELTDPELKKRRADHLDYVEQVILDVVELDNGFTYRFPLENSILHDLAQIIELERKCCPFLSFRLNVESGDRYVTLDLTGPDGTKEIVKSLFGWNQFQ